AGFFQGEIDVCARRGGGDGPCNTGLFHGAKECRKACHRFYSGRVKLPEKAFLFFTVVRQLVGLQRPEKANQPVLVAPAVNLLAEFIFGEVLPMLFAKPLQRLFMRRIAVDDHAVHVENKGWPGFQYFSDLMRSPTIGTRCKNTPCSSEFKGSGRKTPSVNDEPVDEGLFVRRKLQQVQPRRQRRQLVLMNFVCAKDHRCADALPEGGDHFRGAMPVSPDVKYSAFCSRVGKNVNQGCLR